MKKPNVYMTTEELKELGQIRLNKLTNNKGWFDTISKNRTPSEAAMDGLKVGFSEGMMFALDKMGFNQ